MDIRLSAIHLYPVKGIRGVSANQARVEKIGLQSDRRWVVVGGDGKFLSQRTHPRLARVVGKFHDRGLELSAPGQPLLHLDIPREAPRMDITVWRDRMDAAAADPRADEWFSNYLGQTCRLAYMDEACHRPISSPQARPGDSVSFADGYPCLLVSTASLADLNGRLANPLPMDRFRPNLVVEGCGPFAEDNWRKFSLGDVVFRFAGLCARCSVTTVDQESGERKTNEPLQTLAGYRHNEKGVVFGVNLIPEGTGGISVGDKITILE